MTSLSLQKPHLVERLAQVAAKRHTTPEMLLDTVVEEFLDKAEEQSGAESAQPLAPPEFLREAAAFARLKPELLKHYRGRVVAIYQEEVVAVGDNRMDVLGTVLEKLGPVPCYIEWVEEQTPRRVRIPSTWIVR